MSPIPRGVSYVPLDQAWYNDPKMIALRDPIAENLYLRMLGFVKSQRTDGIIEQHVIHSVLTRDLGLNNESATLSCVAKLVKVRLLSSRKGGFLVVAWSKWNDPASSLSEKRSADARRKRDERARHRNGSSPNVTPDTDSDVQRDISDVTPDAGPVSKEVSREGRKYQDETSHSDEEHPLPPQLLHNLSDALKADQRAGLAPDRTSLPNGVAKARAQLQPTTDSLTERAHQHFAGVGITHDDVVRTISALRANNIADTTIDEAIGQAIKRHARSLSYLTKVARNWHGQRDKTTTR